MKTHGIPTPWNEPPRDYSLSEEALKLDHEIQRQLHEPMEIPLLIHGQKIMCSEVKSITLPHDHHHTFATAHQATPSYVEKAIESCLQARREWSQWPQSQRSSVFLKAAERISGPQRHQILAATMLSQNKTSDQAEWDCICETVDFLRYQAAFAQQVYGVQPELSARGEWNHMEARGLEGFVFACGPFNFTALSVNCAVAPALMGCSVLFKPTHEALPASWICLQILLECGLPPGVINMVAGDPEMIGSVALAHHELSGLHFTGSSQTFRVLSQKIGSHMHSYRHTPRVVGETGGKGFVFAHPSADPQTLISALVRGAFEYQGQKCSQASRAYIPQSLWTIIKNPLISLTQSLKIGDPHDKNTFVAALINERAYQKVKGYLDIAQHNTHYEILCGGGCEDKKGYFIEPTLVRTQDPQAQLMTEEIFGPILTIWVYEDDELEGTAQLCDQTSPYALTGAIIATQRHAIVELSKMLRHSAGNLYINIKPTGAVVGQQPFGGSRGSGTNDKAGSALLLNRWVSYRTIKERFYHEDPLTASLSLNSDFLPPSSNENSSHK